MNDVKQDSGQYLQGWKDISAYVGKSVRTAQRWEREYGLPIHRIAHTRDEIVFARSQEIDEWRLSESGRRAPGMPPIANGAVLRPPSVLEPVPVAGSAFEAPAPPCAAARSRPAADLRWGIAALTVVCLASAVGAWWSATRWPEPSDWRVEPDAFVAVNPRGRELWRQRFTFELITGSYSKEAGGFGSAVDQSVWLNDLDGDGLREVVFLARTQSQFDKRLWVFDGRTGTARFTHVVSADPPLRFGDGRVYPPPFEALRAFVTSGEHGEKHLWVVSVNIPDFPAALERLDPRTGRVLNRYWSNGYVTAVAEGTFHRRRVVFVGGGNHEHRGAFLAAIDLAEAEVRAPAVSPKFACANCPGTLPLAFVVFPQMPDLGELDSTPGVSIIEADGAGGLRVLALQTKQPLGGHLVAPAVNYRLDNELRVLRAEPADGYSASLDLLRRAAVLGPAPARAGSERKVPPALRWNGTGF